MPGNDIIRSLAAGLDMMTILAESEDGARVKDIAAKMNIKTPVAHNILRTLKAKGFVVRDADAPVYRISPRLEQLVTRQSRRTVYKNIEGKMQELAAEIPDATVTFSQPVGGEIMVKRRLSADRYGVMQRPAGYSLPLYNSASGLATLAFCSEECYLALQQEHPLLDQASNLWSPPEKLDEYLEEAQHCGYTFHPGGNEKRLAVAAPVKIEEGTFIGTLGISRTAGRNSCFDDNDIQFSVDKLMQTVKTF